MNRRRFITATGVLASPLVAGCSSSDDSDSGHGESGGEPSQTTTEMSDARSAQEEYPDYEWSKLDGVDAVSTSDIDMTGFEFDPLVTAVQAGTEITVVNQDSGDHTVTIPKLELDESVAGDESVSFTVEATGTYDYVCTLHPPGMVGRLVVNDG